MSSSLPPSGFDPFSKGQPQKQPGGSAFPPAGGGFPPSGGGFPPSGSSQPPNPFSQSQPPYPPGGGAYPQPGSGYPPAGQTFAYEPAPQTSPLAVVSLISGIGAWITCCCSPVAILAGVVSIVTGHTALIHINRSGGKMAGKGLAIVGLAAGYLGVLLAGGMLIAGLVSESSKPKTDAFASGDAEPSKTAESAFGEAERKIISNEAGAAKGNSPEAIALAEKFSSEMKLLREALFTEDKKNAVSLTDGEFVTWCELHPGKCAFLVHVPAYRKFDDEAKDSLAELAWMSAQNAVEETLDAEDELGVGLKGTLLYGAVMVGTVGEEVETAFESRDTDKQRLYPFFEPEPALTELPEDAGMIELPSDGSARISKFTDANFQAQVLDSDQPVLVDFWAPWCGPCRMVAPLIDEAAEKHAGQIKFGKLNIDENQQITSKYEIESIPTLIIFKGGEPIERIVGVPAKSRLDEAIEKAKSGSSQN